jgi:SAM-dependent methyltransferase
LDTAVGKAGRRYHKRIGSGIYEAEAGVERGEYERMHALEEHMWWFRGLRALAVQLVGQALAASPARGAVLDAGCGTGGMLLALAEAVPDRSTIGLEHDEAAAGLAAEKCQRPVMVGSANELPVRQGVLAGYLSLDVLCHRGVEPQNALSEARRCLQPGGIVLLNLPAYRWLLSAHDRRVHNVRRFTRREASALVRGHGFRILRTSYWNTFLFPLMLLRRLLGSAEGESDVREFPGWLDRLFSAVLTCERVLIGSGLSFPFGGSVMIVAARHD